MVSVRTAKSKGNQFEYSIYDSLKGSYPAIRLTKQLGFVSQYDLIDDDNKAVYECKRLKAFSWNQLINFFLKLIENGKGYTPFLIFKGNQQPCLVMHFDDDLNICVHEFQTYFGVAFLDRQNKKKVVKTVKEVV